MIEKLVRELEEKYEIRIVSLNWSFYGYWNAYAHIDTTNGIGKLEGLEIKTKKHDEKYVQKHVTIDGDDFMWLEEV